MAVEFAVKKKEIKSIVLDIDSPGGTIDGLVGRSDYIYGLRSHKPVIAYADDQMTSAAYWIGSAAQRIISGKTSTLGSIGISMVHYDYSKADEKRGLKRTFLKSGKYKAFGNDAELLDDQSKAYFQNQLDFFYSIFIEQVARNRNASVKTVLDKMADGKLFIGQQAVNAGLADGLGNLDDAISAAQSAMSIGKTKINKIKNSLSGGLKNMFQSNQSHQTFESLVAFYHEDKGMSMAEAIQKAMRKDPKLHEDFIRRVNNGEESKLFR